MDAIDRLCLHNVSFRYGKESFIKELSIDFPKGVPVAIFAPSGKGKTTLLRILMGLFPVEKGVVLSEINLLKKSGNLNFNSIQN